MVLNDGHGLYRAEIVPSPPGSGMPYRVFFYEHDTSAQNKIGYGELDWSSAFSIRDAKKRARKGFKRLREKTHIVIYEGE
jgi:hypothetical protein